MYEVVLIANVLLWLALVLHFIRLPIATAFHPAAYYLFFHGLVFMFRPIVVAIQGYQELYAGYGFFPSDSDKITVILASMLGLVAFHFAAIRSGNAPLRFKHDRITEMERSQLVKPFLFVAALLVPLAVASGLDNWQSRAAEASSMVLDAATGTSINTTSSGYWADLQLMLGPISVMAVWLFRFRWWSFAPLAGFILLRAGTGGRWPFMMACTTVGLLFLYEHRRALPRFKEALLPILALLLFQTIGIDRGAAIRSYFVEDRSDASIVSQRELGFMESMDFANMEYFEYLVYAVPQRSGSYGYFLDNLQVFTEPIPRVLWADKPIGAPIKLFYLWDYGSPIGMTYSLPGNGWLQLGYLGVAIWCGLFGWFYGWVYSRFQRSDQTTLKTIAFLLFLPLSVQFFRDGVLLSLLKTNAWFLLPLVLTYGFARISAVPLGSELRLRALKIAARRQPEIAQRILDRQSGSPRRNRRWGAPAE
ncbi:MAG: O-antigen polymerase [Novosphingobium sp.]